MCRYALVAVVEHIGGAHGGHYVAYVRFVPFSLSLSLSLCLSLSPCVCVCERERECVCVSECVCVVMVTIFLSVSELPASGLCVCACVCLCVRIDGQCLMSSTPPQTCVFVSPYLYQNTLSLSSLSLVRVYANEKRMAVHSTRWSLDW